MENDLREVLAALAQKWENAAEARYERADAMPSGPQGDRFIARGTVYEKCARELREALAVVRAS